jgi:ATP-dependent Clp protease protease subunit
MTIPELLIDDVIGEGWFGGVGPRYVNRFLKEHAKAKEILVRVNSPGGDVFAGVAIYTALKNCEARIVVEVEGMAASAASYISMAGDEIRVHKGAMFMIHEASGFTVGRASDHDASSALLTKINDEMADLYAARTGMDRAKLLKMMDDETWMNAEESLAMGFCDSIVPAKGKPKKTSKAAAQLLAKFKHAPESIVAMAAKDSEAKYAKGDRVEATAEHMKDMKGSTGEVKIVRTSPAYYGVQFDGEDSVHKWLAEDELRTSSASKKKSPGHDMSAQGDEEIFMSDSDNTRLSLLARIEAVFNKTGDDLHGSLLAMRESHEQLPGVRAQLEAANAQIAELNASAEAHSLEALITKAKADKKCTPAMAESVRASFAAKEITLKGAEAWLANSPVIAALNAKEEQTPPAHQGDLKHDGKSWNELKPAQRADLKRTNPELYEAMRASAN